MLRCLSNEEFGKEEFINDLKLLIQKEKVKLRIHEISLTITKNDYARMLKTFIVKCREGHSLNYKCIICLKWLDPNHTEKDPLFQRKSHKKKPSGNFFLFFCGHHYHENCLMESLQLKEGKPEKRKDVKNNNNGDVAKIALRTENKGIFCPECKNNRPLFKSFTENKLVED